MNKQSKLIMSTVSATLLLVISVCTFNFNDSSVMSEMIEYDNRSLYNNIRGESAKLSLSTRQNIPSYQDNPTSGSCAMTQSDIDLINLSNEEAWRLLSDGAYSATPQGSYKSNASAIGTMKNKMSCMVEVDIWFWADPNDDTNMERVAMKKSFEVNSAIKDLFVHAFTDAFNDPEKPVFNITDRGFGTWVTRGKSWNENNSTSSHSYGTAIDINTESYVTVNGTNYGNPQHMNPVPPDVWETLPETHKKYEVMVKGHGFVRHFEHYGFVWGGEFRGNTVDPMHLSWVAEREPTREWGQENYKNFK